MPATDAIDPRITEAIGAARETRCLEIGPGVLGRAPRSFVSQFGQRPAIVVADPNTCAAAGRGPGGRAGHPCVEPYVFADPNVYLGLGSRN